jgi:hypothetical protein
MIVHNFDTNTGKTKQLFDAEFNQIRKGKAEFVGEGKYIENIGSYDIIYRLDFPDQDELKVFIEELIELYNSREGNEQ